MKIPQTCRAAPVSSDHYFMACQNSEGTASESYWVIFSRYYSPWNRLTNNLGLVPSIPTSHEGSQRCGRLGAHDSIHVKSPVSASRRIIPKQSFVFGCHVQVVSALRLPTFISQVGATHHPKLSFNSTKNA